MSNLREYLGPLQPELLIVNGNQEAMTLALYFGVADKLSDPGTTEPCGKWVSYETHPSHWVICYRSWRNPDSRDNGWAVWFFPKSTFTLKQVFERFERLGSSKPQAVRDAGSAMS